MVAFAVSKLPFYPVTVDWRPTFYAGHTADNDNAKKVAFHRDRNKLVTLGKICVENNRYSFATTPGTSQHRHNTVTSDAPVTSQHVTHPFKGCDDVTLCDEDGEPKTSCVIEPDNTPVQEEKPLMGVALPAGKHRPLKTIRAYCVEECQAGNQGQVEGCQGDTAVAGSCPVFPFRMGRNPNITQEQREKLRTAAFRRMEDGSMGLASVLARANGHFQLVKSSKTTRPDVR